MRLMSREQDMQGNFTSPSRPYNAESVHTIASDADDINTDLCGRYWIDTGTCIATTVAMGRIVLMRAINVGLEAISILPYHL